MSCVCRTPGSDIDLFCESIERLFTDVMPSTPGKSIFVYGECNVDLQNTRRKRFLDCMYGLGLHPLIDRPSRITRVQTCVH